MNGYIVRSFMRQNTISSHSHSSFSTIWHFLVKSLQDPHSIDIQWVATIVCQCWQDPAMICQEKTNYRKTQLQGIWRSVSQTMSCYTPRNFCLHVSIMLTVSFTNVGFQWVTFFVFPHPWWTDVTTWYFWIACNGNNFQTFLIFLRSMHRYYKCNMHSPECLYLSYYFLNQKY